MKPTVPYMSVKIVNKNKVKVTLKEKLSGVKVKIKYKGKTYSGKTNKNGQCSVKVKKKLISGKKLYVTASKSGYNTRKSTYKVLTMFSFR